MKFLIWWAIPLKRAIRFAGNHAGLAAPLLLVLAALLLGTGCNSSKQITESPQAYDRYIPGYPNFFLGAQSRIDEQQQSGVDVIVKLPYNNLIFKRQNAHKSYKAKFEIQLKLHRLETGENPNIIRNFVRNIEVPNYKQTKSFTDYLFVHRFRLQPGEYQMEAVVSDFNTEKSISRHLNVHVPNINNSSISVTNIQLLSKNTTRDHKFKTELAYHIPDDFDSLKSNIQLYIPNAHDQLMLEMNLLRIPTDTLPARLPYFVSPHAKSLEYKGLDTRQLDTIQTTRRHLTGIYGKLGIDFTMPELSPGTYRIKIEGTGNRGSEVFTQRRDFSLKSRTYPTVSEIDDMIESLIYIASPSEYNMLIKASKKSKKEQFDAFWGSLFENRQQASETLTKYYNRVEEANRLFTTYKEGWKTDFGMIYIIFGPPTHVEHSVDGITWHYSFDSDLTNGVNSFFFEKLPMPADVPFTHFQLERSLVYERIYRLAVQEWRSGAK